MILHTAFRIGIVVLKLNEHYMWNVESILSISAKKPSLLVIPSPVMVLSQIRDRVMER